ncbi:PREDICTED: microtubule-associated protein 10-like [Priapulus caudatus]|uniref:Microtubule-associated protein 10-like n=1 Tax=Priapulus caudatus TaxID=37621 RepID=A0ABM1E4Q0_PRICU|nr:PREDICTED: microtubule-associated protein 10-like [Priapulus caudatus]XP_014667172.1 PREDICTED: microtubule-associated protein 10-like [Priapulus caudatus]
MEDIESLFSVEVIVDSVRLFHGAHCISPAVAFRLLDLPSLLIQPSKPRQAERHGHVSGTDTCSHIYSLTEREPGKETGCISFCRGKSCLFKTSLRVLASGLTNTPMYILLIDGRRLVGSVALPLVTTLSRIRSDTRRSGLELPCVHGHRGTYTLHNAMGTTVGEVVCSYRIGSLGSALLGHVHEGSLSAIRSQIKAAVATGETVSVEVRSASSMSVRQQPADDEKSHCISIRSIAAPEQKSLQVCAEASSEEAVQGLQLSQSVNVTMASRDAPAHPVTVRNDRNVMLPAPLYYQSHSLQHTVQSYSGNMADPMDISSEKLLWQRLKPERDGVEEKADETISGDAAISSSHHEGVPAVSPPNSHKASVPVVQPHKTSSTMPGGRSHGDISLLKALLEQLKIACGELSPHVDTGKSCRNGVESATTNTLHHQQQPLSVSAHRGRGRPAAGLRMQTTKEQSANKKSRSAPTSNFQPERKLKVMLTKTVRLRMAQNKPIAKNKILLESCVRDKYARKRPQHRSPQAHDVGIMTDAQLFEQKRRASSVAPEVEVISEIDRLSSSLEKHVSQPVGKIPKIRMCPNCSTQLDLGDTTVLGKTPAACGFEDHNSKNARTASTPLSYRDLEKKSTAPSDRAVGSVTTPLHGEDVERDTNASSDNSVGQVTVTNPENESENNAADVYSLSFDSEMSHSLVTDTYHEAYTSLASSKRLVTGKSQSFQRSSSVSTVTDGVVPESLIDENSSQVSTSPDHSGKNSEDSVSSADIGTPVSNSGATAFFSGATTIVPGLRTIQVLPADTRAYEHIISAEKSGSVKMTNAISETPIEPVLAADVQPDGHSLSNSGYVENNLRSGQVVVSEALGAAAGAGNESSTQPTDVAQTVTPLVVQPSPNLVRRIQSRTLQKQLSVRDDDVNSSAESTAVVRRTAPTLTRSQLGRTRVLQRTIHTESVSSYAPSVDANDMATSSVGSAFEVQGLSTSTDSDT